MPNIALTRAIPHTGDYTYIMGIQNMNMKERDMWKELRLSEWFE